MKIKTALISMSIILVAAFIGGGTAMYFYLKNNPISWKWTTKTVTEWLPSEKEIDYKACYDSPIWIEAELIDKTMKLSAGDMCKIGKREMEIDCRPVSVNNIFMLKLGILGGYNYNLRQFDYAYNGSLDYLRMWKNFGIGAGIDGQYHKISKDIYGGVHITLAVGK